ncbi:MAG: hypothetical protein ACYTES_03415, partial [Planctomycetota bacterium]
MKVKTLSLLAGVGAPLFLTASSDAGFNGVYAAGKTNPFGIFVCNVYAEFDNAGNDFVLTIAGTQSTPLVISVVGGTFWNHPTHGGDSPPTTALVGLYPSLAYDTFATVGVKAVGPGGQPADNLVFVNYPLPIAGTSTSTTNGAWAVLGLQPQGNPFDPINSFPGDGSILIGQFSTTDGIGIVGTFLLQYWSDGVVTVTAESFEHFIPA